MSFSIESCKYFCAGNAYSITVVPLYDTLGPQSTCFILAETKLKTVVTDGDCLDKLLHAVQQHQEEQQHEQQSQQQQQQNQQQHRE